jgi:hypothetical protein
VALTLAGIGLAFVFGNLRDQNAASRTSLVRSASRKRSSKVSSYHIKRLYGAEGGGSAPKPETATVQTPVPEPAPVVQDDADGVAV